jgi:hypothetical protein
LGIAQSIQRKRPTMVTLDGRYWEFNSQVYAPVDEAVVDLESIVMVGRHAKTGKTIAPLAPAANPERFTSLSQSEKWFKRNCNDVLARECTAQEKGDVLAYLMQLATGSR